MGMISKKTEQEFKWVVALIQLKRNQRKERLEDFCRACKIEYRLLYRVWYGKAELSQVSYQALRRRAAELQIEDQIAAQQRVVAL